VYPFEVDYDAKVQWLALFLIFWALFLELLHGIYQIVVSVKEWY
jgi:hypothetical protein